MKAVATIVAWVFFGSSSALAQGVSHGPHTQTTPPPNARYEIVSSSIALRDTYRLDRFTGKVHRLVRNTEHAEDLWEEMIVVSAPEVEKAVTPRFQIFLSGIAVRATFLIDTSTGKTWELVLVKVDPDGPDSESNQRTVWAPIQAVNIE